MDTSEKPSFRRQGRHVEADLADLMIQQALRQHALVLRKRSAELAGALQRYRDRQAQIDAVAGICVVAKTTKAAPAWLAAA